MSVPGVVRTDRRVLPARLERIGWYHPEWAAALVALEAWLLLVAHDRLRPTEQAISWVHAQGEWALMATAMMLPAALPTIRQVALEISGLDKAKLDALLDARSQTEPGTGAGGSAGG